VIVAVDRWYAHSGHRSADSASGGLAPAHPAPRDL
jgi:hypothetical protein